MDIASGGADPWPNTTAGAPGCLAKDQKEMQVAAYGYRKTTPSEPFLSGVSESEAVGNPDPSTLASRKSITSSEGNLTLLFSEACRQNADTEICLESTDRSTERSGMQKGFDSRDLSKLTDKLKVLERRYSTDSGSKPGKPLVALSLLVGLCGTLNLFGLAGTSPTPAQEAMLWGAIAGVTVLHSCSALETIMSFKSGFPDFKSKSMQQQLGVIVQQMKSAVFPLFATLPDDALAYFGISARTGLRGLGATAALLTAFSETLTFKLLASQLLESLKDSKNQIIDGFSNKDKETLYKICEILDNTGQQSLSKEEMKGLSEARHLLESDRKLRRGLEKLIANNKNQNKPVDAAIREFFTGTPLTQRQTNFLAHLSEHLTRIQPVAGIFTRFLAWSFTDRLEKAKGVGKLALHGLTAVTIFTFSAEFFAARGLVSSVSGDPDNLNALLNATLDTMLSDNQTQPIDLGFDRLGCLQYEDETSAIKNALLNMVGYCGAAQAVFIGGSLSRVIEELLKKSENLYAAVQENEFIEEIKSIFYEGWKVKVPAVLISGLIAYCYRSLAASNASYLDELEEVKKCDIEGFDSYLPSIPGSNGVIVNAAYFMSMSLYLLPFLMIFDLVFSGKPDAEIQEDNQQGASDDGEQ